MRKLMRCCSKRLTRRNGRLPYILLNCRVNEVIWLQNEMSEPIGADVLDVLIRKLYINRKSRDLRTLAQSSTGSGFLQTLNPHLLLTL